MRSRIICVLLASFSACQSIPDHEVVQLRVDNGVSQGGWAARVKDPENVYWKPASQMQGHLCRSPRDEQKVIEWIKRNCGKEESK